MKKLSKKDLEALSRKLDIELGISEEEAERDSFNIGGLHDPKSGEIYVSYDTPLLTKLHEVGHKKQPPKPDYFTYRDWIDREIDAEIFAYESLGKPLNWKVGFDIIIKLVREGWSENNIFVYVKQALEKRGIYLSKKDRHNMWWFIKEFKGGGDVEEYTSYLKEE